LAAIRLNVNAVAFEAILASAEQFVSDKIVKSPNDNGKA
jgi:hypothetical protein